MTSTTHSVPRARNRPIAALAATSCRGFTLVELMVVIGIIVLLLGVAITVGRSVANSGRARQTEHTLRVLDTALSEYIHSQEGLPRPWVAREGYVFPIVDGVVGGTTPADQVDSVALFMLQCQGLPQIEAKFRDIDARLVPEIELVIGSQTFRTTTVLDGWGRPLRYVHPQFGGVLPTSGNSVPVSDFVQQLPPSHQWAATHLARTDTNSDSGIPVGTRPYFYSAGPDGDPSTVEDNIYVTRPQFQQQ